jgi:methionyl-tRNA formyltransferase
MPPWWIVYDGETTYGITVHKLEPELDAGDILTQHTAPMPIPEPTAAQVLQWACDALGDVLEEGLRCARFGEERWTRQDPEQAFTRRRPRHIHRKIDWGREDAATILRKVRAGITPYASSEALGGFEAFFLLDGRPVIVREASLQPSKKYFTSGIRPPGGSVLSWGRDHLDVATCDEAVVRLSRLSLFGWPIRADRLVVVPGERMD